MHLLAQYRRPACGPETPTQRIGITLTTLFQRQSFTQLNSTLLYPEKSAILNKGLAMTTSLSLCPTTTKSKLSIPLLYPLVNTNKWQPQQILHCAAYPPRFHFSSSSNCSHTSTAAATTLAAAMECARLAPAPALATPNGLPQTAPFANVLLETNGPVMLLLQILYTPLR